LGGEIDWIVRLKYTAARVAEVKAEWRHVDTEKTRAEWSPLDTAEVRAEWLVEDR